MAEYFDKERWSAVLQHPDWYLRLADEYRALKRRAEDPADPEGEAVKRAVREFFEEKLKNGEVALAQSGDDLDAERQPIDTIVIHHTSAAPGYSLARMNAVHLLNLYAPYYAAPTLEQERHLKGRPIWSNHLDESGRQVFYGYHWILRMDGRAERLLPDGAIGWHAGNWNINTRSVGICLDNDYVQADPGREVLAALAGLIRSSYPAVQFERVLGHREVGKYPTVCPGEGFAGGWKKELQLLLEGRDHDERGE